jgi:hypothetical protein
VKEPDTLSLDIEIEIGLLGRMVQPNKYEIIPAWPQPDQTDTFSRSGIGAE